MGKATKDLFREKYDELDKLCQEKYNKSLTAEMRRKNITPIRMFAESLTLKKKECLLNIISIRKTLQYDDLTKIYYDSIKDLDEFIFIIKGNHPPKRSDDGPDLAVFIEKKVAKMKTALENKLNCECSGLPIETINRLEDEFYNYIEELQQAKEFATAKKTIKKFYYELEKIEQRPVFLEWEKEETRTECIEDIQDELDEVLDEIDNPFKRIRAREIANRYILLIKACQDSERMERFAEDAIDALDDLF